MDDKMSFYRERYFPNFTNSLWKKIFSQILGGAIAPFWIRPWLTAFISEVGGGSNIQSKLTFHNINLNGRLGLSSSAWVATVLDARPVRGGPAGTLFRGPTATEGPEIEETFEWLLLTDSE